GWSISTACHEQAPAMIVLESVSPRHNPRMQPAARRAWRLLSEDWLLPEGTPVTIRPIRASDAQRELAFVCGLSRESRYQRLFSVRNLLPGELRRLTDIDYEREMALIATVERNGIEEQIGVARYVRDHSDRGVDAAEDGDSAEIAIVVGDAWQGRGLGEKLLRNLVAAAGEADIRMLTGVTLATNAALLSLARKIGFSVRRVAGDASTMRIEMRL
ncbi:MAG: GNAT family N-acetyltransferase, partial [Betaproteobacteria bacterium]